MRKTKQNKLTKRPVAIWMWPFRLLELVFAVIWEVIKHMDGYIP